MLNPIYMYMYITCTKKVMKQVYMVHVYVYNAMHWKKEGLEEDTL